MRVTHEGAEGRESDLNQARESFITLNFGNVNENTAKKSREYSYV